MKAKNSLVAACLLILIFPSIAIAKNKKGQRGMLESMQSVPCGAKERGVTGVGSIFGSVGVQHVNSHEQLCPQYLLRTDEMDYHIRPLDLKHAAVLPVGHEAEFKIKKDRLFLRMADGEKKSSPYQVISMQPANSESKADSAAYHPIEKPIESRPPNNAPHNPPNSPPNNNRDADADKVTGTASEAPPPQ